MNLMLMFLTSTRPEEANKPQEKIKLGISCKKLSIRFHILFVLLSIVLCDVYGEAYSQEVSLSYKNEKLDVVLKSIGKQSGYRLFYNSSLLIGSRPVTIHVQKSALKPALDLVFANQPLTFALEGQSVIIRASSKMETKTEKQLNVWKQETITGSVSDSLGNPLAGVSVKLKGTNMATSTDAQGTFTLTGSSTGTATLVFSLLGYRSREEVFHGVPIRIKLNQEPADLEEVVVVGYGSVRKSDLTGAVASFPLGDQRLAWGILQNYPAPNGPLQRPFFHKFVDVTLIDRGVLPSGAQVSYSIPLLRYAEMFLIAAEAENALNGPSQAYPYINEIRRRARVDKTNPTHVPDLRDLTKEQLQQAIWKEWDWEMHQEGLSWMTMKRTNTFNRIQQQRGATLVVPVGVYNQTWPIPNEEVTNNNIPQNPLYQ